MKIVSLTCYFACEVSAICYLYTIQYFTHNNKYLYMDAKAFNLYFFAKLFQHIEWLLLAGCLFEQRLKFETIFKQHS